MPLAMRHFGARCESSRTLLTAPIAVLSCPLNRQEAMKPAVLLVVLLVALLGTVVSLSAQARREIAREQSATTTSWFNTDPGFSQVPRDFGRAQVDSRVFYTWLGYFGRHMVYWVLDTTPFC